MRHWILGILLYGLFALVIHFAAPEMIGSPEYHIGVGICALIAMTLTWGDPPCMLDNVIIFLFKWGVVASAPALIIWGIGYKLGFWGNNPDEVFSSVFYSILLVMATFASILIIGGCLAYVCRR